MVLVFTVVINSLRERQTTYLFTELSGIAETRWQRLIPNFEWETNRGLNIGIILLCEYLLGWNWKYIPLIYGPAILIPLWTNKALPFSYTHQIILFLSLYTQKWIPALISGTMLYLVNYYHGDYSLSRAIDRVQKELLNTLIFSGPLLIFLKKTHSYLLIFLVLVAIALFVLYYFYNDPLSTISYSDPDSYTERWRRQHGIRTGFYTQHLKPRLYDRSPTVSYDTEESFPEVPRDPRFYTMQDPLPAQQLRNQIAETAPVTAVGGLAFDFEDQKTQEF